MFGDVVVTYERMQEIEFSFFTLPDSGAFLTHAPRRLSEALALVYPFQMEVWPALIFTVIISGPILYLMIIIPEWLLDKRRQPLKRNERIFNIIYIKEITRVNRKPLRAAERNERGKKLKRDGLFARCVWFTCHIFLRQCS